MNPTANKASGGQSRGKGSSLVPLATVLTRLDEAFEEPLDRAASLPGYAEFEAALAAIAGWPATGGSLVILKEEDKSATWKVLSGIYLLAAAKKVGKADVPCSFVAKDEVSDFFRANAEGGLTPPRASPEEEEEAVYRAYWPD